MRLEISEVGRVEITDDEQGFDDSMPIPEDGERAMAEWLERRATLGEPGGWYYVGVCAAAKLRYVADTYALEGPEVRTPGVWHVESDAGEEYLDQIYHEELLMLREMLLAMGLELADINLHIAHEHKEGAR